MYYYLLSSPRPADPVGVGVVGRCLVQNENLQNNDFGVQISAY